MGWAALAVGLVTFGAGLWGADAQEEIEHDRVELAYQDNLEKIRRRGFQQESIKGQAKARSENAGVLHRGGSTAEGFMTTLSVEFKKELDWMKQYADRARSLGIEAAHVERKIGGINAAASGISAGASVI